MGRSLLGFELDIWDYVTFATIFLLVVVGAVLHCWLGRAAGTDRDRVQAP